MTIDDEVMIDFLTHCRGAMEVVIVSPFDQIAMILGQDSDDDKIYCVATAVKHLIVQAADPSLQPKPKCMFCQYVFDKEHTKAPGIVVVLLPFASRDRAVSCGICIECVLPFETLEQRIKTKISSLVPESYFVEVPETPDKKAH
jgi:hypothetical protein